MAAVRLELVGEVICYLLPLRASVAGLCGRYRCDRPLTA